MGAGWQFDLDLLADGDAVFAKLRDRRLEAPRQIHCIRMDGDQPKTPPLAEAESVQVVIGGDEPDSPQPALPSLHDDCLEQCCTDPVTSLTGVQRDQLAGILGQGERRDARALLT